MSVINNVLRDLEARESSFTPIEITSVRPPAAVSRRFRPLLMAGPALLAAVAVVYLMQADPAAKPVDNVADTGDSAPAAAAVTVAADNGSSPLAGNAPAPAPTAVEPSSPDADVIAAAPDSSLAAVNPAPSPGAADQVYASLASIAPADETPIEPVVTPAGMAAPAIGNEIIGLQLREAEQEMQMEFVLRERAVAFLRERGENHFAYRLSEIESRIQAPTIRDNRWIRELSIGAADGGVDISFETMPGILVETSQRQNDGEALWTISLRHAEPAPAAEIEIASLAPAVAVSAVNEPAIDAARRAAPSSAGSDASADTSATAAEPVKLEIKATNPAARDLNRLDYAVELINSRRYDEAEKLLQSLLGGGEDHLARQRLIALYERDRQDQRLAAMALESMQAYPGDAAFRTEYARVLFRDNAFGDIVALLADASPANAPQQSLLAASYQRLEQHEQAVQHYRLALETDAGNARNWVGLAISQEHTAALEDALNSYQQAGRLGSLNDRLQAFVKQRSDTLRQALN